MQTATVRPSAMQSIATRNDHQLSFALPFHGSPGTAANVIRLAPLPCLQRYASAARVARGPDLGRGA